jgi:hypothetical protein
MLNPAVNLAIRLEEMTNMVKDDKTRCKKRSDS